MQTDDLEQWLLGLPLDDPFLLDGESVFLKVEEGGAELGLVLAQAATGAQMNNALRTGFQGALEFEAGLALSPEGGDLLLNRWLPGVETWVDAAEALESILNQASMWRAAMKAPESGQEETSRRNDQRMRKMITKEYNETA